MSDGDQKLIWTVFRVGRLLEYEVTLEERDRLYVMVRLGHVDAVLNRENMTVFTPKVHRGRAA